MLGLGHVGLPTALGLAELGWDVVGTDDDLEKAQAIAGGRVPFYEPGVEELLKRHLDSGRFVVEPDVPAAMREATVLFVCVGTPEVQGGAPDLSQLERVARSLASNLNGYKLIVEKSTTPVQTSRQIEESILRYSDSEAGDGAPDFDVAVNPEFLREGTAVHDFFNPDRIVLGVESERAEHLLLHVYQPLLDRMDATAESKVVLTDSNTAEIIKHASNAFLATKISFANMVGDLCEATGANVEDVAHGMGMDPRIGQQFLKAGLGYGGYCLPKDVRAFIWIAERHRVDFSILGQVNRFNGARVDRFIEKVRRAMGSINGNAVAVWGLAFKPGTDDVREASSLGVVDAVLAEGGLVRVFDPRAMPEFKRRLGVDTPRLTYWDSPEEATMGAAAVLILTEWPEFLKVDLAQLRNRMSVPLIVDGRNLLNPGEVRALGFEYDSIGRP